MSTDLADRDRRLQIIAARWPRFAWDYRGRARWQSFDASFWTALLAIGLLIAAGSFDLPLLLGDLGGSPGENALLALLLLTNVWVLDRHLTARTPAGLSEARWLRWARRAAAAIPLVGLAVIPLWQWLIRNLPSWAFHPRPAGPPLRLEGRLPRHFGLAGWWARADARLRSWSQRLLPQIVWLVACQLIPLFWGLSLLHHNGPGVARPVNLLLHLAGAAAAAAHVTLRSRNLQMTGGRALLFRLLPLAFLLPVPFSLTALLIWLPSSEETREEKGVVQTLYRTRSARRHRFAAVLGPRSGEITGAREGRRRRASAAKIALLALESAVLAGIAAKLGWPLLPIRTSNATLLMILLVLSALPGVFLLLVGEVARIGGRQRLAFLADHPYGTVLTLVPLALTFGILAGTLAGANAGAKLGDLLMAVGLAGILATLLAALWTFLLALFFGTPERPFTGRVISLLAFALLLPLSSLLSAPPVPRPLVVLIVLTSPLAGLAIASCWLAPFRLRDLLDRRLSLRQRVLLWGVALTAILPLGGLAVPAWVRVRHHHGPALDRQAARLRSPMA